VAKKRRQAKIPTPAWERPRSAIGRRILGRSFQLYGLVAVAVLIAIGLGIIGFAFAADEWENQRRPGSTAIKVEDTRYRLDYFSRRLKMFIDQNGGLGAVQDLSALPQVADIVIEEEIARRFAAEEEVSASDDEIREKIATRLGIKADDPTFDVVFQQELTRSSLSEQDYLLMAEAAVLSDKLRDKFLEQVPESAESVRFRQILVSTDEAAQAVRDELEAGGDFAALAAERSLDVQTKDSGGEVGWVPRGVLDTSTAELVFDLEPGGITAIPTQSGVFVIEMLEKAADRAIDEVQRTPLAQRAFADWVQEKRGGVEIVNNMDVTSGDPDKINWVISRAYDLGSAPVSGGQGG
jgi:foldase protein PrsA